MERTFDEKVELFFLEPKSDYHPDEFSALHLLRRHIRICLCIDPKNEAQAIWPAAIATLSGIDLLGLYYSGEILNGRITNPRNTFGRFNKFCLDFLKLTPDDSKTIYMLRNAFVHTYGLLAADSHGKIYRFTVFYKDESWLISQSTDLSGNIIHVVNLFDLYKKFESAIGLYRESVIKDSQTHTNFEKVFTELGTIGGV
ncbi:MAG: hypothetical protein CVU43_02395 [Chloroflexi bacterium HGW-Chloroflexi-5]|jgi:hypothetical protein|nr:MAG: hypothetical protein CVU43_02395 [Chloroflexi bacterium HGW-Chloroflexi-5]